MVMISIEEYKILKSLDDDWEWIARDGKGDGGGNLFAYLEKPFKDCDVREWNYGRGTHPINAQRFQFIQWKDWEPYNIQELIREYESEKTEVKGSEWLKEETSEILLTSKKDGTNYFYYRDLKEKIYNAIDQLDKPEVLSPEWLEENEQSIDYRSTVTGQFVESNKLQNIIVPKQELPVIPKYVAYWIEEMKEDERPLYSVMSNLMNKTNHTWSVWKSANKNFSEIVAQAWLDGFAVEEEPKYYALIKGYEKVVSDDKFWNYCITDESLDIGDNEVHTDDLAEYVLSATKDEWENLGINNDNADFVEVEELEE